MNYNNFKRHEYYVSWVARKDKMGEYARIDVHVTRDYPLPYGDIVTDVHEFKYGCRMQNFHFDDLDIDENGIHFIKEGSGEWYNYLNDPGISPNEYLKMINNTMIEKRMETILQEELSKKGVKTPVHVIATLVD